ncbi:MAG: PAS domain-containing protein, partial [Candidatus Hydrogenedentes bacterium]|nr:PAS domain-containing protein [Candidatus Hydrogenedentota bacterium]
HPDDRLFFQRLMTPDEPLSTPDLARLRGLFHDLTLASNDIVYVHDMNGTLLYVNEPGLSLARFDLADVSRGITVYDLIAPEYVSLIESRLEVPGAVSRAPYVSEIYTKDGDRIPIELTTRCLYHEGRMVGVIGLARDLRLARRLENEIARSRRLIEAVAQHASIGIMLLDVQGAVIEANPAAVALFGAPNVNALAGHLFMDLCTKAPAGLGDMLVQAFGRPKETWPSVRVTSRFGAELHCDITVVPVRLESKRPDRLILLLADITVQVALQQNLIQTEKLSAIGEIVAGVAHELNNPLTGILGYAQLLNKGKVAPTVRSRLEHIMVEAERCRRIVQNLLSFTRHHDSEKSVCNINDVLNDTLQLREYQLRIDGIALSVALAEGLPSVVADIHEMQRVFLNIMNNAQQALATVEGGSKRLAIRTGVQGRFVEIVFHNNGPAIPEWARSKVFDPFFTTKGVGEGTGLGLSVSYGIVSDHGGRILLDVKEGEGVAFTVLLPLPDKAGSSSMPD